jgi:hypothetical protein
VERDLFSVREADTEGSAKEVVPESKDSLVDPIVIQEEDHLDPSIRLFSMLDSNPDLAKIVETLLKSQSPSPKPIKENSNVNTLLWEVLKLALSRGDRDSSSDDVRKPKKEIPKFGPDDSVMGFFSFFRSHAVSSWKVPENSKEFVPYFESAIQGDKSLRKEYWDLKNRHTDWTFKDIIFHLIESFDGISEAVKCLILLKRYFKVSMRVYQVFVLGF